MKRLFFAYAGAVLGLLSACAGQNGTLAPPNPQECAIYSGVKAAMCSKPGLSADAQLYCATNLLCPPAVPASGAK